MSILGNNLLAQYYAQNQGYVKTPSLWIEADSWGYFPVWTNKGNGGYDLTVKISSRYGAVDGNAIIASNQQTCFDMKTNTNVVGTGSFTIEFVANPSALILNDKYGGWIYNQRTLATVQASAFQIYFSKQGFFEFGGWKGDETTIFPTGTWDSISYVTDNIQYFCCGYDAATKIAYKQINNTIIIASNINYSCNINNTVIGAMGWENGAGSPFLGSLYSLRVYQRTLSEAERANNMRRDKARFNF